MFDPIEGTLCCICTQETQSTIFFRDDKFGEPALKRNSIYSRKGWLSSFESTPDFFLTFWAFFVVKTSVADPDPVISGPFWSDPDPDDWDQIRILALINDPILTFLYMCKSHKYFRNLCCSTFWFMKILLENIFIKKISGKKLAENLYRSGSGSWHFRKSDPDPVKKRPDPQHW
jgi:hypothetical protein